MTAAVLVYHCRRCYSRNSTGNQRCRAGPASHRLDIDPRIEPLTAASFAGGH